MSSGVVDAWSVPGAGGSGRRRPKGSEGFHIDPETMEVSTVGEAYRRDAQRKWKSHARLVQILD